MKRKHEQPEARKANWKKILLAFLGLGLAGGAYWAVRPPQSPTQSPTTVRTQSTAARPERIPPFYESEAAAKPFPVTLPAAYFRNRLVARAYRVAQEIPGVLAQQPCYCYCEKFGHHSLLDCFASDHGAG